LPALVSRIFEFFRMPLIPVDLTEAF
jgi:hypothetical protein